MVLTVVLQKVLRRFARRIGLASSGRRVKLQKLLVSHIFIHFQNGRLIAAPITIIGCRKYSYHLSFMTPIVAFHDELMCTAYEIDAVRVIELSDNVRAEQVASASWTYAPADDFFRVGPQEIAHGTFVWYFLFTIDCSNLIQILNGNKLIFNHK